MISLFTVWSTVLYTIGSGWASDSDALAACMFLEKIRSSDLSFSIRQSCRLDLLKQDNAYHYSCTVELDTTRPLPVEAVVALGVKLIGLKPFFSGLFSGVATTTGAAGVVVLFAAAAPLKLATLLPKKLPIPLPIPPKVARISATGGLGRPLAEDGVGDCMR